jgi:hypothetical protein
MLIGKLSIALSIPGVNQGGKVKINVAQASVPAILVILSYPTSLGWLGKLHDENHQEKRPPGLRGMSE